ncbi:hypothetical protein DXG03_002604 [Asterophora parasitica]|uniref:Origin recognition complex subunit 3 winged helix C-terminal domain-containing protein n=1 Tax=Asterophora parasitica TaxID=117018 RepID=A0A9P7G3R0_9AGAR|nr:hypothetical protein DXG03_002604 [Asterophora parasitica]
MIGPSVLTILADHYNRHDPSMDTALNILHLAHLKHFSAEPLTVLTTSTPSSNTLAHDASSPFTDALLTRLQPTTSGPSASDLSQRRLVSLISSVDDARTLFYSRARRLRIGFGILKLVQAFMTNQGYKGLNWAHQPGGMGILDVMNDALRGKLGSDIKYLGTMVRKLRTVQLEALLEAIHAYFHDMPSDVRSREEQARTKIVLSMNALRQREESVGEADSQAAASFGEWLVDYMNNLLTPLEESILWEVWYTGLSPFPIDLINPSLRASVIAGLLQPHDFADKEEGDDERSNFSLWELPDTSILFHRYLDSGRMINLYDWFESFRLELETQREKLKSRAKSRPRSPTKRSKKGTAKAVDEPEEKDEETWKLEVQARFMRALQELDYLGFIKHTGRKADHVQRVVFDIRD